MRTYARIACFCATLLYQRCVLLSGQVYDTLTCVVIESGQGYQATDGIWGMRILGSDRNTTSAKL